MGLMESVDRMEPMTGIHTEINGVDIRANRTPLIYEGECTGAVSFFLDVSEYECVCKELQVSKSLTKELDAIFESSYDGLYIADHEGRVTRVNTAWEKICGFSRAEVVGKKAHELVSHKWYDKSAAVAALEHKKTVTLLVNLTAGPRKGNQVMATGTPIFDDDGKIVQVVVNVRDMSDLDLLQRRLEATEELNQRYVSEIEQIRLQQLKMDGLVAKSPEMKRVVEMAARIATVDSTILIMGESGVGKEVITNKIHALSRRKNQPFIKINCGAIPENLLESELFGYAGGAFTGAKREGKPGMFELASNGTLFLDEIGELPLGLQVKLLRVLQDKTLVRVGGIKTIPVDVRVIAATNKDLPAMVKAGTFRDDLYYRLNVFGIQIPPLRERREDLPPLLHEMLDKFNAKYGTKKRFAPATVENLINYDWPGNVREVENLVERLVVLVNEPYIETWHLPEYMHKKHESRGLDGDAVVLNRIIPYKQAVEELESLLLERALVEHRSTRKVARVLEVNQSTIVRKMKQYRITRLDA
jgi:PAS domain S-box-containing protein